MTCYLPHGAPVTDSRLSQLRQLKPRHLLVSVTAYKNRIFILTVAAKPVQWRKAEDKLRKIYKTFMVV